MRYISVIVGILFLLVGCINDVNPNEHRVEIYKMGLESMIEQDKELNRDMKFIAIDMSTFNDLDEQEKEAILIYFQEIYKVDVMNTTLDDLKAKKLYNLETKVLDGVLLQGGEIEVKSNKDVVFRGSKYRAPDGGITIENIYHYKGGKWQGKESRIMIKN